MYASYGNYSRKSSSIASLDESFATSTTRLHCYHELVMHSHRV
jgi:hypothetical protein